MDVCVPVISLVILRRPQYEMRFFSFVLTFLVKGIVFISNGTHEEKCCEKVLTCFPSSFVVIAAFRAALECLL